MSDDPTNVVTGYLRRLAAPNEGRTDAELLARYARQRDDEAFALIVRRHGPMVLGVCRRALGHTADADDAFQATFLALARNAAQVTDCVPGWLYRVAVRASRKALRRYVPTPDRDEPADPSDALAAVEWRDVRRLLDDELNQLPERWRSPLVLCYLEGLTRDEAARQLGWSLRTLHRRLDEGRVRLRARLARRGLAPAILASAVLSATELRADRPAHLARDTAALAMRIAVIPGQVRALIPNMHAWEGLAMKLAISALVLAGAVAVTLGVRQPAGADPPRPELPPGPAIAMAPVKRDKPPPDPLAEKVKAAQEQGIKFLKKEQKDQGRGTWNWENDQLATLQPGGTSALALLALLESGVKVDDEVVARGLKYLRTVEPKHTYVVSLQTQVLCKANQKEDAKLIERNVAWLEMAAVWNKANLEGWSYGTGGRPDNSNTRYAVSGLYAAQKAGFKVNKADFWAAVRDYYVSTQTKVGGWNYVTGAANGKGTHTMTLSGIVGLCQSKHVLGKDEKATDTAIEKGWDWIASEFTLKTPVHLFYNLDLIAAAGRISDRKHIGTAEKKRDWYREGADWLIENQKGGGEWKLDTAIDNFPVISTSFALRFLASRPD